MHEFIRLDEDPEPQPSGHRFGPPNKFTLAGLLDPSQFPPIRPRCFGCARPLALREIGQHVRRCDKVAAEDLARFNAAWVEFEWQRGRAREVVEQFLRRIRI